MSDEIHWLRQGPLLRKKILLSPFLTLGQFRALNKQSESVDHRHGPIKNVLH